MVLPGMVAHGLVPQIEPHRTIKVVQFGSDIIHPNYNHYIYVKLNYFEPVI